MGYLIMPELKEPQVCKTDCQHVDCAEWRKTVGKACETCGEPVEAGNPYYYIDARENRIQHFRCAHP